MTVASALQEEFPQVNGVAVDLIISSTGEILIQIRFELFQKIYLLFEQPQNFRGVEDMSSLFGRIRYIVESELDAQ